MKILAALLVVLFVALQYRLWFGDGSVQELWRVREEARASAAEVARMTSRNQALSAEVADLKSGIAAIEERARTDLGMIDHDETFYQFVRERDVAGGMADDREEAIATRGGVAPRAIATPVTGPASGPVIGPGPLGEEAIERRPRERSTSGGTIERDGR